MSEAALIAHLVSQTQANVSFLQAEGYLSPSDASEIRTKLATANKRRNDNDIVALTHRLGVSAPPAPPNHQHSPSPHQGYQPAYQSPPPSAPLQPPQNPPPTQPYYPSPPPQYHPPPPRAKALWAYNEDGREPNDLSFSAGENIEIVEETNPDWWTGRNTRGVQGLFPSNYVEKVYAAPMAYKPFGVVDPPPPSGGDPLVTNDIGLQQDEPDKKKKFGGGKYGGLMAQSAAGGLGFGAGAAVGGGIVNAIF